MNYFELTHNIKSTHRALRMLVGATLLLAIPTAMKIVWRTSEPTRTPTNVPEKPPFRMRTCRGG